MQPFDVKTLQLNTLGRSRMKMKLRIMQTPKTCTYPIGASPLGLGVGTLPPAGSGD
jgi:hypothetical protein